MVAPDDSLQGGTASTQLLGWAEAVLREPVISSEFCGHPHAQSRVWRLSTAEGCFFAKQHRQPRKFVQETRAYRDWGPRLGGEVPRLLGVDEAERVLLLSEVGGRPLSELDSSSPIAAAAFERAGVFLRRLHVLEVVDEDPMPPEQALRRRALACAKSSSATQWATVADEMLDRLESALGDRQLVRVPCHRDFDPRNWMVDGTSELELRVIDFEHARPDVYLQDLVRIRTLAVPDASRLEAAFWSGYGRAVLDEDRSLLDALALLDAMATLNWAERHHDEHFLARGRSALARLGVQD